MISLLDGVIKAHEGNKVIIVCGGVGYGVNVCPDDQGLMRTGSNAELCISESIKEDAYELYGFLNRTRKELFVQLTSVNGVGPKAAMAILAIGNEQSIRKAIAEGDTAYLARANGVGKKVAERVVVDLKNKVGLLASDSATSFLQETVISDSDEAVQALVALGYSVQDAKMVLGEVDNTLSVEERVSKVLKGSYGN